MHKNLKIKDKNKTSLKIKEKIKCKNKTHFNHPSKPRNLDPHKIKNLGHQLEEIDPLCLAKIKTLFQLLNNNNNNSNRNRSKHNKNNSNKNKNKHKKMKQVKIKINLSNN